MLLGAFQGAQSKHMHYLSPIAADRLHRRNPIAAASPTLHLAAVKVLAIMAMLQ